MQRATIALIFILLLTHAYGQVKQIKYTRIDQIKKETDPGWGEKSVTIEFNLISLQNLNNDSSIYGVEVNINSEEKKVIATSIGLSNLGKLWGSSVNSAITTIKKEGYKFLTYEDLETIEDFLIKAVALRGKKADYYTIYKLTLSEKIQIGLKYDPEITSSAYNEKLQFIITVEEATYTTSYETGMEIMQKLNEYRKKLTEFKY